MVRLPVLTRHTYVHHSSQRLELSRCFDVTASGRFLGQENPHIADKQRDVPQASRGLSAMWEPPPLWLQTFFPNGWEFLVNFLHTCYAFLSTLVYKFLFNYLQHWRSYAILSETTHRIFLHFTRTLISKFAYWANDVTVDVVSYPACLLTMTL